MKVQRTHYVGLAGLSYTLVLLSGGVSATTSESTAFCYPELYANGDCDNVQNIEACGYDGGDCCECTCISTTDHVCGEGSGFACVDPSASCDDDDTLYRFPTSGYTSTLSCLTGFYSDGDCDPSNNNEDCGYDGGDCCQCTCVSTDSYTCGDENHGGYACLDPSAPCVDDDDVTTLPDYSSYSSYSDPGYTSTFSCATGWFSDGLCDLINNNEACGYDGGDCCECTCVSNAVFTCGDGGFACVDSSASCVDDDDYESFTTSLSCIPSYLSDAYCDQTNNNEACGYDGGDCCSCTCVSNVDYTCGDENNGGYACVDPSAPCVDDDDVTAIPDDDFYATSSACIPSYYSDGDCDLTNNNKDCGYDSGDCCQCTCVSTDFFTCGDENHGGYACLDPSAPCVDDDDVTDLPEYTTYSDPGYTSSFSCLTGWFSNGLCDTANNNEDCGYDGGDCCECTCISTNVFTCGVGGFACVDPSASCADDDDYEPFTTSLSCIPSYLADAYCDQTNNNEECGYDGGDCCSCTCISNEVYTCGDENNGGYACVDPSAPCVDDDDVTVIPDDDFYTTSECIPSFYSDGDCDPTNNNEDCGYDGGDCCQCTCVSTDSFTCGDDYHGGYACLDPTASCVDDDDVTTLPEYGYTDSGYTSTSSCFTGYFADGYCDQSNNNEECGYDGGDCCECDCVSISDSTCGNNDYNCTDPSSPCVSGYVEAGTKTTVGVSANAYDTRPGEDSGDVGCGEDGCTPALSRDGISTGTESRWACAQKLVSDGNLCEIEFMFEEPQDIMDVQVAFYKGEERSRTLEAAINGVVIGEFESYTGSTFNALGIEGVGVQALTFTTVGLTENEWISVSEVRFLVEP